MNKEQVLSKICDVGIVAVVRAKDIEQAKRITDACLEGGVNAIEITFTVPKAHNLIEELAGTYGSKELILGAGTVMDPETARIAILSGAQYVVSPSFNSEMVKLCHRYRVPCMPGAMTIAEAVKVMESGADIIKLFPGELFGPQMIKSIKGPIPQARIMPTGGVSIDNVDKWIKAGAVAVGAGSSLISGAAEGDYKSITEKGKEFIKRIKEARSQL